MPRDKMTQDDMQEIWLLVFHHAQRLKVEITRAVANAVKFAELVSLIESDGRLKAKNLTTSASGLYQFVSGSVEPAVNRLKKYIGHRVWMDRVLKSKDASQLKIGEQTLLFLGDILEKRGSDKYMANVLASGSKSDMLNAYLFLHHTDPDEATFNRAKRIFYGLA